MDPYVKMSTREQNWRSTTCKKGDKEPKWSGQVFEIDVKYMGDDIDFDCLDQDPGKDEEIGHGSAKISAFCCQEEWDEWFEVEKKGKRWGKVHIKSTWMPKDKPEEKSNDEVSEIQNAIRELAEKRKELSAALNEARDAIDEHDAEGEKRIQEAKNNVGGGDEQFDQMLVEINERAGEAHGAADAMKEDQEKNRKEFEDECAKKLSLAAEARDAVKGRVDEGKAAAEEKKAAELAAAEEAKTACEEKNAKERADLDEKIAEVQRSDNIRIEHAEDEIKETAEKLLKINEMIQERLQKLTEL